MPDSSVPPPPTRGASPALTIVVVLMLAGSAVLLWRAGREGSEGDVDTAPVAASPTSAVAPIPSAAPAVVNAPPPPPPPVEEAIATGDLPTSPSGPGPKDVPGPRRTSPCGGDCGGTAPPELEAALSARAQQARSCYQAALRQGASGEGRLVVAVRVAQNGVACGVSLTQDTLGNAGVSSCVSAKFRSGSYPPPKGGCVDTQVPINFVSKP